MAISGKCTKISIVKADGSELDISQYVGSVNLSEAVPGQEGTQPARQALPSYEVSFTVGADSEFARALRRWLRRWLRLRWTKAWLEQFAAWAFGKN